mgnify:CR=1 FL=1
MQIPTAPTLIFRGLKRAQSFGEMHPCSYKVLGWQSASLLYESTCSGNVQNWPHDIENNLLSIAAETLKQNMLWSDQSEHTDFIDLLEMSVHPPEVEASVIAAAIRGGVFLSPNKEWATIVARHTVYGPEDVLIVSVMNYDPS